MAASDLQQHFSPFLPFHILSFASPEQPVLLCRGPSSGDAERRCALCEPPLLACKTRVAELPHELELAQSADRDGSADLLIIPAAGVETETASAATTSSSSSSDTRRTRRSSSRSSNSRRGSAAAASAAAQVLLREYLPPPLHVSFRLLILG
ncbi:hypothetical protein Emag_006824 [Eimeria magna]